MQRVQSGCGGGPDKYDICPPPPRGSFFQVLWATPRLPNSAMAAAVSLGRFKWPKNSLGQAPLVPYFFVPFAGVGVNLEPKYEILFY